MDVSPMLRNAVEFQFEPTQIRTSENLRRADIEWGIRTSSNWIRIHEILNKLSERGLPAREARLMEYLNDLGQRDRLGRRIVQFGPLWLASPEIPFVGMEDYLGISSDYRTFLRGDTPLAIFLRDLAKQSDDDEQAARRLRVFTTILSAVTETGPEAGMSFAGAQLRRIGADLGEELTEGSEVFINALSNSPVTLFDTSVWSRRRNY